jgi:hypothetical protein
MRSQNPPTFGRGKEGVFDNGVLELERSGNVKCVTKHTS